MTNHVCVQENSRLCVLLVTPDYLIRSFIAYLQILTQFVYVVNIRILLGLHFAGILKELSVCSRKLYLNFYY
jgi:hypothetical protein